MARLGLTRIGNAVRCVVPPMLLILSPHAAHSWGLNETHPRLADEAVALLARSQPFEAVRDRVEESWRTLEAQRAFAKLLAELREKADIEIDEAALADDALWQAPEGE